MQKETPHGRFASFRGKLVSWPGVLIVVVLVIIFGTTLMMMMRHTTRNDGALSGKMNTAASFESASDESSPSVTVYLYFCASDGRHLKAEERTLRRPGNPAAFGRAVVAALIQGPEEASLWPSLPDKTTLNAVYVTEDGVAYVDFSTAVSEAHPGGAVTEYLSVFSVVNSLVFNIPEISRVKILIGGREAETLAGHMDLSRAYEANMVLIR